MPHSHERARRRCSLAARIPTIRTRSEEHTSELQSQSNLVCRLLLEKKKATHSTLNPSMIADMVHNSHNGPRRSIRALAQPMLDPVITPWPPPSPERLARHD